MYKVFPLKPFIRLRVSCLHLILLLLVVSNFVLVQFYHHISVYWGVFLGYPLLVTGIFTLIFGVMVVPPCFTCQLILFGIPV